MSALFRAAGMDIGSRTIELVILEEGVIVESYTEPSGSDPLTAATDLLHDAVYDRLIATGYGRHLLELARDLETVTEIKAYAVGARALCPECRTVLDIVGRPVLL